MFRSCFVARVAVEKSRAVELFCTFDDPQQVTSSGNGLPPAQALGGFCFPLGSDNVTPKEYMAPEVPPHILKLVQPPFEPEDLLKKLSSCRSILSPSLLVMDLGYMDSAGKTDPLYCAWKVAVRLQPQRCAQELFASTVRCSYRPKQQLAISSSALYH